MELLMQSAPQELPYASLRRSLLTRMSLTAKNQIKEIGLLGLAGCLLAKSMQDDKK
jgi:tetrathionate reductase subunit B